MIKLVCQNCLKDWYTANTDPGQKCEDCGGELKEEKMENGPYRDDVQCT